jgi:glycosyltransferase involved in cell wall biosynthesis
MATGPRRILLWHGYLLTGSGSNIYTNNVARTWRAGGHHVLLVCQEPRAADLDFLDQEGDFARDNRDWSLRDTGVAPGPGRCTLVRPAIGRLLPVYVLDRYEGFAAKRFVDLTDEELERYTAANVAALARAIEVFEPHAVIVGHEVMGPYIARLAGATYLAKLHGSALEYAVKVQQRYLAYARDGLCGARVVTGGSRYMIEAASAVVPGWVERAVVVNPGCDVDLFRPVERERSPVAVIGYVGKLIAAKGVHDLLGALGLTSSPLRVEIVGYGSFEPRLRALARSFRARDRAAALAIARRGDDGPLVGLDRFLAAGSSDAYWARAGEVQVAFRGRLEHEPLARVLPTFDVLAVPSVVPEAFGMVAAEAAACGVLPVVPAHSGIGEVGRALEAHLGAPGLLTYDPARPLEGLAEAIDRVLALPRARRRELGLAAAELARTRWSWTEVARRLLELAAPP